MKIGKNTEISNGTAAFLGGMIILALIFVVAMAFKFRHGAEGCASIGAEYRWGRDFSVCVMPDGSMWKVP